VFSLGEWERILKNKLRRTIFPMDLSWYSEAYSILHVILCSTDEPVLGAKEGMKQITGLHHFFAAPVASLRDVKPSSGFACRIAPQVHLYRSPGLVRPPRTAMRPMGGVSERLGQYWAFEKEPLEPPRPFA